MVTLWKRLPAGLWDTCSYGPPVERLPVTWLPLENGASHYLGVGTHEEKATSHLGTL
jgi:hypothetical protein